MTAQLPTTSSPSQMSFSIFEEAMKTATPLAEIPRNMDIGFNRNHVFLDVKELGLVAFRAMDAAYFLISQDPDARRTEYDYDLTYFKWLIAYDSNNRHHLRQAFREIQKSAISVEVTPGKEEGADVPLMGPVAISGGRIAFKIDALLLPYLKKPESFSYLSLRMSASFSSAYARVLYYRLSSVAFRGGTEWMELDAVRAWMSADTKTTAQFKYFRRDVLDPAVEQINDKSDIHVRYETKSAQGSKRIAFLKFVVSKNPKYTSHLLANPEAVGSQALYQILKDEFGLSDKHLEEIIENRSVWSDDWLYQAIDFTRARLNDGKIKSSPAGYLMMAIRQNLKLSAAELKMAEKKQPVRANKASKEALQRANEVVSQQVNEDIARGAAIFDRMDAQTRMSAILTFSRHHSGKLSLARAKVAPENLTEEVIRSNEVLARAFGAFVFTTFGAESGIEDAEAA